MKTAIVYYSKHHGNTRQLLDAIAKEHDVTLIDVTAQPQTDLTEFDRVGFASGIYYSKFHKTLLQYAQEHLPQGKDVFFLYTYGAEKKGYTDAISQVASKHQCKVLGSYGCFGFNTFGPFKLVGGIAKNHPNQDDLKGAVRFYEGL